MNRQGLITIAVFIFISCGDNDTYPVNVENTVTIRSHIITRQYTGNGVQWGGYDMLEAWTGSLTLSEEDWNTLFKRVRFMRPPLVRIMVNSHWNYIINNEFDPSKSDHVLVRILDFCEQEGIAVILGEWGHTGGDTIDHEWLNNSAGFLKWLLETKNYSCIKYFNMVNEPNGTWSTTDGNYSLWKQLVEEFYFQLTEKGIAADIKLMGPDIAVWNTNYINWITDTRIDLETMISACDIHTYPTETEVREGSYKALIKAYKNYVPASCEMIMSEFGFKYASGSELGIENSIRIAGDPYTSDDSNMLIYDAFYGVDIADAIMQNMLAGYAGIVLWDMDDAMYNIDGSTTTSLKRWGFWNILGTEKFDNAEDENIRPWFYPASLMCRYFPEGTAIHDVTLPDKKGLRAVAGVKNGKYTIAIVNSGHVSYTINLTSEEEAAISSMKSYRFIAGQGSEFTGSIDDNGFAIPYQTDLTLDFSSGKPVSMSLPPQSFWLFTNME